MLVSAAGGTNGTISARKMKSSAGYFLDYNLYTTVGRNVIWGNGTTGLPVNVSGGLLGLGHWQVSRPVYGRVTPTIATRPGTYTDTIVIRIDW